MPLFMPRILVTCFFLFFQFITASEAFVLRQDSIPGIGYIDSKDLEIHVEFLASPYLKGRANGSPELEIALNYIVSQVQRTGLKSADSAGFLRPYKLLKSVNSNNRPHFSLLSEDLSGTKVNQKGEEVVLHNVIAWIEGSDPLLKSEFVIFSCHADHIGKTDDKIYPGADDDASGCAALLEIAEAFSKSPLKPLRSVGFLWLTGEEIGLFGSKAYINDPIFPLGNTVADLNLDMIGRVRGIADSTSETPVSGESVAFIISDDQSSDLMSIAEKADRKSKLNFDYSLSGRGHPLNLFARSDHFNFVKKDIPSLFFTTGLHSDYHGTGDVPEKLDYKKMELVTKTIYMIGFEVANRRSRLAVDNPYTKRE